MERKSIASCVRSTMPTLLRTSKKKFSSEPSVKFKSPPLSGHLNSKTHSELVQLEQIQRGSIFQREVSDRKAAEFETIECVMRNLYFLMKEEIQTGKQPTSMNL